MSGRSPAFCREGPGHSHQAVNDIAVLATIPGLELVEPCCAAEVAPLLDYLVNTAKGSGYLRLVSIPCEIPYSFPKDYRAVGGRGIELRPGKDVTIIGYGPVLLPQAWHAAELLKERYGLDVAVVNLPWLSYVDREWLRAAIGKSRAVFLLDNHLVGGGQGKTVAVALAGLKFDHPIQVRQIGITDFPVCGQKDEVLRAHGLDAESLAQTIAKTLQA